MAYMCPVFKMRTLEENKSRKNISSFKISIIAVLFGLSIQAFVPIFMKLSEFELNPNVIIFHRSWMTALCVFIGELFQRYFSNSRSSKSSESFLDESNPNRAKEQLHVPSSLMWLILGMGILFFLEQLLWAWSLTQTRVSSSSLVYGLTPVFSILGEWIFFGISFSSKYLGGIAIAVFGLAIVGLNDWQLGFGKFQGDIIALLGTLCFSGYLLAIPKLRLSLTARSIFFWRCSVNTLAALPIIFIMQDHILPTSWLSCVWLLGLTATSAAQFLFIYSMKTLSAGLLSTFLLLDPLISSVAAHFIFSEVIGIRTWLAALVILFGIYLCTADTEEETSEQTSSEIE